MKKTPIVFVMDYEKAELTPKVRPGCEWVISGQGVATIKFDGQAALWRDGKLWKRYDRKLTKKAQARYDRGQELGPIREELFKVPPEGFEPCEPSPDPVSFHWPGWVPVDRGNPADKWFVEALDGLDEPLVEGATYELVGPSLALNIYKLDRHELWRHGKEEVELGSRSFEALREFMQSRPDIEGLVFHHPDGRMAKIRRKDFGLFWVQPDMRRPPRRRRA